MEFTKKMDFQIPQPLLNALTQQQHKTLLILLDKSYLNLLVLPWLIYQAFWNKSRPLQILFQHQYKTVFQATPS